MLAVIEVVMMVSRAFAWFSAFHDGVFLLDVIRMFPAWLFGKLTGKSFLFEHPERRQENGPVTWWGPPPPPDVHSELNNGEPRGSRPGGHVTTPWRHQTTELSELDDVACVSGLSLVPPRIYLKKSYGGRRVVGDPMNPRLTTTTAVTQLSRRSLAWQSGRVPLQKAQKTFTFACLLFVKVKRQRTSPSERTQRILYK